MDTNICRKCGATIPLRTVDGDTVQPNTDHTCASCDPPKGAHGGKGITGIIKHLLLIGVLGWVGFGFQKCSFDKVAEIRQMARVPETEVRAVVPGETKLTGTAIQYKAGGGLLVSPDTKTRCIYYRYHVERRETDSDGDSKWVTVRDDKEFKNFLLKDETGEILIKPNRGVDFNIPESHTRRRGDMRYTEYRLDPGDQAFVFGYAEASSGADKTNAGDLLIAFNEVGDYIPLISEASELEERVGRVSGSIFLCWAGLVFIGAATVVVFSMTGQHRLIIYFWVLSAALGVVLVYLGVAMMRSDIMKAHEHIVRQDETVRKVIKDALAEKNVTWDGEWGTLGRIGTKIELTEEQTERLRRVRIDLAAGVKRVRDQAKSFPYSFAAATMELPSLPELDLPYEDQTMMEELEAEFQPAKLTGWSTWLWGLLGLVGAYGATWFGLRSVKLKRMTEALATSPSAGVAFGLTELKGIVDLPDGIDPLSAPLSHAPCVTYNYKILEKRGSGKKAKWVTIHDEDTRCDFLCRDSEGTFPINPDGAEIMTWRKKRHRQGRRKHIETRLQFGDPLYAIGMADIDPDTGDSLYMRKPDKKDEPFLLSSFTEKAVVSKRGVRAVAWVTGAFGFALLAGLMLFASQGAFSPADYLLAALIGPAYLFILTIVLHYNDLIFLRQRARRNWANIEVSLKKRFDLMPSLVKVAKGFMEHEKEVQTAVTSLRQNYGGGVALNPEFADNFLSEGQQLGGLFMGLVEKYPDIKADTQTALVTRQLIALEDEIAFMRVGYNDAVTQYNTRISVFPDSLLANIGKLQPMDLLTYEAKVVPIPEITQETWRRQQAHEAAQAEAQQAEAEGEAGGEPDTWSAATLPMPDPQAPIVEARSQRAFLLATLLDKDPELRAQQIALIQSREGDAVVQEVNHQLPAVEDHDAWARLSGARQVMPELRSMSAQDYLQFKGTAALVIEMDDRVDTYEYAFRKALSFLVDPVFIPFEIPEIRYSERALLEDSIAQLKAHLASPANEANLGEFHAAMDDVFHAPAELRKEVYSECHQAFVNAGGEANTARFVLIQALADGLFLDLG